MTSYHLFIRKMFGTGPYSVVRRLLITLVFEILMRKRVAYSLHEDYILILLPLLK